MKVLRSKTSDTADGNKEKPSKKSEREENRKRIEKTRANHTEEEKKKESGEARVRMKVFRAQQTTQEKEKARERDRIRKRNIRQMKSKEMSDYELILKKQRERKSRENETGKEHLLRNLKQKKGMQLLNTEGRLRQFSRRELGRKEGGKWDEMFDWEQYSHKSKYHSENLASRGEP